MELQPGKRTLKMLRAYLQNENNVTKKMFNYVMKITMTSRDMSSLYSIYYSLYYF